MDWTGVAAIIVTVLLAASGAAMFLQGRLTAVEVKIDGLPQMMAAHLDPLKADVKSLTDKHEQLEERHGTQAAELAVIRTKVEAQAQCAARDDDARFRRRP
jgi:UDP-N-acetylmuramyl tripeptide synthase